jgi:glycerol-3-phosphate dehydrogenase (NAD(P)+)
MQFDTAIIFGAGAFGTSIASVLSENFNRVIVKVRSQDIYDSIKLGENAVYLSGQKLASNIVPALTWEELDQLVGGGRIELLVNGLPTSAISSFYGENEKRFKTYFKQKIPLVSLSKGIDPDTLELPDDLFNHYFSDSHEFLTYLSGPSFAKEILDKQVTIVSLAGKSPEVMLKVAEMLQTDYFKAFPTYDVKGVLLGGALKNILAIAGGMLEGMGFNHNTRAAMITRGITEMLRFGKVFNARPETFYSFAGMGDLILTTTSDLSRNKTFGMELAKGRKASEIIASSRSVVEGYKTTLAAHRLAEKYHIRTRLFEGIYQVLFNDVPPQEVIKGLMELPVSSIE